VELSALRIKTSRCSVGLHSSLNLQKICFCKFKKYEYIVGSDGQSNDIWPTVEWIVFKLFLYTWNWFKTDDLKLMTDLCCCKFLVASVTVLPVLYCKKPGKVYHPYHTICIFNSVYLMLSFFDKKRLILRSSETIFWLSSFLKVTLFLSFV